MYGRLKPQLALWSWQGLMGPFSIGTDKTQGLLKSSVVSTTSGTIPRHIFGWFCQRKA